MKFTAFFIFVGLVYALHIQDGQAFFLDPVKSIKTAIGNVDKVLKERVNKVLTRAKAATESIDEIVKSTKENIDRYDAEIAKMDKVASEAKSKGCDVRAYEKISNEILANQNSLNSCLQKYDMQEYKNNIASPVKKAQEVLEFLDANTAKANDCVDEAARNILATAKTAACLINAKIKADTKVVVLEPLFNRGLKTLEALAADLKNKKENLCDVKGFLKKDNDVISNAVKEMEKCLAQQPQDKGIWINNIATTTEPIENVTPSQQTNGVQPDPSWDVNGYYDDFNTVSVSKRN